MECPEDLRIRAEIMYTNGFMGFQAPCKQGIDKDRFIISWNQNMTKNELEKIKFESKSNTLKLGDWIGRDYISIH